MGVTRRSQATSDHTIVRPRPCPLHLGPRAVEAAGEGSTTLQVAWLPPGPTSSVRPQNRGFMAWAEWEDTGGGAQLACSSPGCVFIRGAAGVILRQVSSPLSPWRRLQVGLLQGRLIEIHGSLT